MITGTTEPTFTPDAGAALNLNHVTVLKDEPVFDNVIHKSILNGAQKLLIKGYHWAFEVNVNLFKEANPTAKYDEIYSRLYTLGKLQRHRDGCFIQDSSLEPVYFYMTEVVPYYLQSDNLINPAYDAVIVRFISSEYVDMSKHSLFETIDDTLPDLGLLSK